MATSVDRPSRSARGDDRDRSRGRVDPYDPVLDRLRTWLDKRQLTSTVLTDATGPIVGLTCEVVGAQPGPALGCWTLAWTPRRSATRTPGPIRQQPRSSTADGSTAGVAAIPKSAPRSSAISPPAWPPSPTNYTAAWCPACEGLGWLREETDLDWTVNPVSPRTAKPDPIVVFYSDWFTCAVCGLELEGDEFDYANLEYETYLDDEDPSPYITPDEDHDYESWRDDQITERQ